MKRQPAMKERSCWAGACFSRAWGSGRVRQLRRRYLGAPGLHFRPRPKPVVGSIGAAAEVLWLIADSQLGSLLLLENSHRHTNGTK
jgi:hypothetical protein